MDLTTLYEEIFELLEEKSKHDSPNEPYKSKYEAREKLEAMKCLLSIEMDHLSEEVHASSQEEFPHVKAQFAAVLLQLGIIGLETEELSTGQEHLEKVVEIISSTEISPKCIILAVLCYNNIAVLWAQRDEQEKAQLNLTISRDLYNKYRNKDNAEPPLSVHELFLSNTTVPGGWDVLEKLHTLTLYYLAQVMGKLGNTNESAHLCLSTLHRQLSAGEYQVLSWAINAATLAKFYHDNQKYRLARRLLAAAWTMVDCPLVPSVTEDQASSNTEESEEKLLETKAEVARRWGMYCVSLLHESYNLMSSEEELEETPQEEPPEDNTKHSEEECLEQMEFCKLELSAIEENTDCKTAADYEEAKRIFMSGLRWLNEARGFYTLEDHASTHSQIIQDTSALYKFLAYFDPTSDRRSKMHKRRVDLLTTVLNELNSQYYLQICRQLDYELGETYSAMVDCKYDAVNGVPDAQQADKINILAMKGIHHFQNFLSSFNNKSGKKPERYPEECERPVLIAYFHSGRLWSKVVSEDVQDKTRDINNTLENYKFMVEYCDKHTECVPLMALELPVCREMVELLPYKLQRIRNQI